MKSKLWIKILILSVVATLTLLSGLLVYKGFNIDGEAEGEAYSYNTSRIANYKVYLVENSYYDLPYLSSKDNPGIEQYAASLIDYIDVDFNYNYRQSVLKDFYISYSVKAIITGQYENSKNTSSGELWRKNYLLIGDTDVTSEHTSTYDIKQNVKINYNSYNLEVSKYRAATHLAIDANLKVMLQVNSYDTPFDSPSFNRQKPVSTDEIALNIPLTTSATKIEKSFNATSSGTIVPEHEVSSNSVMIATGVIGLVINITIFIIVFRIFFKDDRTHYEKQLDKILKNYNDIIAEVDGNKVTDKTFIDIKAFEDLVDIEEELKTPILYYEITPGKESWFIIKSDTVYRYILKKPSHHHRKAKGKK